MKDIPFTIALKEVIREDLKALDEVIEEDIEVLADIGNPEKLIGKPYWNEQGKRNWTNQDLQMLAQVYGNDDRLEDFIFNKELKQVLKEEEEL